MKRLPALLPVAFCVVTGFAQQSPDKLYGPLFQNVQMHEIFRDQKTFVGCVPIRKPSEIMADYQRFVREPNFNLKAFVAANFTRPQDPDDLTNHINRLWRVLRRDPTKPWKEVPYSLCPIRLNVKVFKETGKLMEKYDVTDTTKLAGGGEYPGQDGFGWTNGVLLKLISIYGVPNE
jgi:neutral trehalase